MFGALVGPRPQQCSSAQQATLKRIAKLWTSAAAPHCFLHLHDARALSNMRMRCSWGSILQPALLPVLWPLQLQHGVPATHSGRARASVYGATEQELDLWGGTTAACCSAVCGWYSRASPMRGLGMAMGSAACCSKSLTL